MQKIPNILYYSYEYFPTFLYYIHIICEFFLKNAIIDVKFMRFYRSGKLHAMMLGYQFSLHRVIIRTRSLIHPEKNQALLR